MLWKFAPSFFTALRLVLVSGIFAVSLMLSGCVSSTSITASYGGPSISSVSAKRSAARKSVRKSKSALRTSKRAHKALNRQLKKDQRRIKRKRISKKEKRKLLRRIKANKRELRRSKRKLARAERQFNRAKSKEKRAIKAVAKAKKRKIEAQRRMAAETKRNAAETRRLAKAEKLRNQKLAQNEAGWGSSITSVTSGLFSFSDPALKHVRDYGARVDSSFPVAAIPVQKMSKRLYRQEVRYRTSQKAGTLVVDTRAKFLYLVKPGGRALRYGIGVGKAGFEWSGAAHIGWKQQWPKWTPPDEMIERRPDLAKWSSDNGGMPGGPTNPLGARALYLMQGGVDTLYRLHGTPEWSSIGTAASSGCIRLMNHDIIDLYGRVRNGTKVVVL